MTLGAINELGRDVAGSLAIRKNEYGMTKTGNRVEMILSTSFGRGLASWQIQKLLHFPQFRGVVFCDIGLTIVFEV